MIFATTVSFLSVFAHDPNARPLRLLSEGRPEASSVESFGDCCLEDTLECYFCIEEYCAQTNFQAPGCEPPIFDRRRAGLTVKCTDICPAGMKHHPNPKVCDCVPVKRECFGTCPRFMTRHPDPKVCDCVYVNYRRLDTPQLACTDICPAGMKHHPNPKVCDCVPVNKECVGTCPLGMRPHPDHKVCDCVPVKKECFGGCPPGMLPHPDHKVCDCVPVKRECVGTCPRYMKRHPDSKVCDCVYVNYRRIDAAQENEFNGHLEAPVKRTVPVVKGLNDRFFPCKTADCLA